MAGYIEFYGFTEAPFKITPDVDFFYSSPSHRDALLSLEYMIESDEGFMVITGEPGMGKTITIRKFINELDEKTEYAYILFPSLKPEEMFRAVLEDFGIDCGGHASKNKLFGDLRDFLIEKKQAGKKVLLIIDEAQNLPVQTLEELRIISNLETEKSKLIQIILTGQPELDTKLASRELRQLKQRITVSTRLGFFDPKETGSYIRFRLAKAGGGGITIEDGAVKAVHVASGGNPRLINIIMERAVMAAFINNERVIKKSHALKGAESAELHKTSPLRFLLPSAAGILGIAAGILFFIYSTGEKGVPASAQATAVKQVQTTETIDTPPEEAAVAIEEEPATMGLVEASNLNVRKQPALNSDKLLSIPMGTEVEILEEREGWLSIRFDTGSLSGKGWVSENYIGRLN
ncbi:AAA family ATPase [Limisalsivibrio acetivorans]|uniref:AAA family ATPase n=1 Tax=Limisalsivibrio acetivorans TaxID=1304888 RepID=UPI0003B61969|nr:AAA family ATPase [Limisalsivibrio acetivorans]